MQQIQAPWLRTADNLANKDDQKPFPGAAANGRAPGASSSSPPVTYIVQLKTQCPPWQEHCSGTRSGPGG